MKPARERILAVDDSPDTLDALLQNLAAEGYEAVGAAGGEEALRILARETFDFVISDMKMPGMSGMELIRRVRERYPRIEVMMITGYATIEGAVAAVKTGAEEYLAKPFTLEELFRAVDRLREQRERRAGSRKPPRARLGLLGDSDGMQRAFAAMEQAARHPGPVLILGEPGTGRTSSARAVAALRDPAGAPFLTLDPAGASQALEADFWKARGGRFSIYIPEVDLAGPEELATLEGLVAGHALLPAYLYLSAGPDLALLAEAGIFPGALRDLLAACAVTLPPLRERERDGILLAEHFVAAWAERTGRPAPELSESVRRAILAYRWPGNVGELRDEMVRALLRSRGESLELGDLPPHIRDGASGGTLGNLAQAQEEHIQRVLASVGGHRGRAAEILGIDPKTLRERLRPKGTSGRGSREGG